MSTDLFLPLTAATGVVIDADGVATFVTRGPANQRLPQRVATEREVEAAKSLFWGLPPAP